MQYGLAPRELSQVAYFMATNSLYLTTFCLEMRSEIVAATCIYLAFAWSEFEVGLSSDGRVCSILTLSKFHFFSSEMVVVFGQRFDWRDAERKRSNIYQDIRGLSPSIDQMVDLSWPLVSPQDCLTLLMKEHPTRLREMKQQCDSQNANPRSDSKSRDPMKSGGVAKIESESRSSSYGSGVKRSGSQTNRNDHDTNRPPESKRIKTEQPRPDVKSEFTDDKKWVLFFICLSSNNLL